jgi:hypothetical protein
VKPHPIEAPDGQASGLAAFEYFRKYFPHYRQDGAVRKFIVPIRPVYHRILFSDYVSHVAPQLHLFDSTFTAGNAIKQAYLCHSQFAQIHPGDVVLFYRSFDAKAVTSLGIVEQYETLNDADEIADRVRRRTVYSMDEIKEMAHKPTKVMLFRLVKHFANPPSFAWIEENQILKGNIQTIREIDDNAFQKLISHAA